MAFIKVPQTNYVDDSFFDISKKTIREISGYLTIKESIENIIMTYPGEILFEPGFGCGVIYRLFDNFNDSNVAMIKELILTSLERWEPRILLLRENVTINKDIDNHAISITLSYVIKQTGEIESYKKLIGV